MKMMQKITKAKTKTGLKKNTVQKKRTTSKVNKIVRTRKRK